MDDDWKEATKEADAVNLQGVYAKIIPEELRTMTTAFSANIQISDGFGTEYPPYRNRLY
jgi:hypothetical protein